MDLGPVLDQLRPLFHTILSTAIQIAVVVITGYLTGLVQYVQTTLSFAKEKYRIEMSAEQESRFNQIAQDAVYYAEEWAASKVKQGETVVNSRKWEMAKSFARLFTNGKDINMERRLYAKVGGTKGVGASKDVGV